jgi:hypothetical protein
VANKKVSGANIAVFTQQEIDHEPLPELLSEN